MTRLFRLSILIPAIFMLGCISTGRKVNDTGYNLLEEKISTKADVERILGKPTQKFTQGELIIYRYQHVQARLYQGGYSSVGLNQNVVEFLFNEAGILEKKFRSKGSTILREKGFGGYSTTTSLSPEVAASIRPGDDRATVVNRLGPPMMEELGFDGTIIRTWIQLLKSSAFKPDQTNQLIVTFDEDDRVTSATFREE